MVLVNDHLDHELGSEIRGAGYAKAADKAALDALTPATLAVGEIRTTTVDGLNWQWDGSTWLPWTGAQMVLTHNDASVPAVLADAVGRRTFDGVFPGVTGSGVVHNVATPAEFDSALVGIVPGSVIVLADGVWDLSSASPGVVTWSAGQEGTAENPIVVRPATVDGVTLTLADDLVVNGAHVHFWNLNIVGGSGSGSVVRFFQPHCKWLHSTIQDCTTQLNVFKIEDGHYLELADLTFTNVEVIGVAMAMANNGGGGTRAKNCWFHHWDVDNTGATTPGELVQTGLANLTASAKWILDDDYTGLVFEFMDINWHVNGDSEIVSGKSSGDVYRYNVVNANDGGGHLSVRDGSDTLVYGNYLINTSLAFRFNGRRNLAAYNVVVERAAGTIALQLHMVNTFGDRGSYDNRVARNLFIGDFTTFLKVTLNGQPIAADPNPKRNTLSNNWWDGAGTPTTYTGDLAQAEVDADNTIIADWLFDGSGIPEGQMPVTLGDLAGSPDLGNDPGGYLTVPPPFWWADAMALAQGDEILYPPASPAPAIGEAGSYPTSGLTSDRPSFRTGLGVIGFQYFDTDLNAGAGMLIVWNGTNWVNPSTGATV